MALFMVNSCKFRNCNLIFETLAELIQHVEETHIDLEREDSGHPQYIAMSKVFRFYGGAKPKKSLLAIATTATKKVRQRNNSVMSTSASIRSLTPTSSEYDFDEEDGGDNYKNRLDNMSELELKEALTAEQQWTNQLILRMMSTKGEGDEDKDKSFVCPIKGCKKRYKNINGAKHHARTAHKREARVKSISKCFCGKAFQTAKQLEQHAEAEHSLATFGVISAPSNASSTSDPKLSITVKDEPAAITAVSKGQALSIVHPITISGGVLLTPATARHLKTVNKGDILVAHKIATSSVLTKQTVASLVGTSVSSLVTPPTTPQKRTTNLSLSTFVKPTSTMTTSSSSHSLEERYQKAIDEKVAQALATAKQEMEAKNAAAKISSSLSVSGHQQTIVTLK